MNPFLTLKQFLFFCLFLFPLISLAQEKELGPNDFVLLEREPAPLNLDELKQMIGYPPKAKEQEIEGKVVVRMYISKTGNYLKHVVIKDPHPLLTQAVTSKISKLRFTPGIQYGKPIDVWVTIPFDFKLLRNDAPSDQGTPKVKSVYYDLAEALAAPYPALVLELYLNGKGMQQFPKEVFQFPNLQKLELGDNAFTILPPELSSLTHLRYLGLSMNRFTALPAFLWSMPSLRQVNVSHNLFPKAYQKTLEKAHGDKLSPKDAKGKVVW